MFSLGLRQSCPNNWSLLCLMTLVMEHNTNIDTIKLFIISYDKNACYHGTDMSMYCIVSSFLLQSCEFVKKRDDTVLRVVWNGDLRLIHNGNKYGSCRRWFFTINGQECSGPRTIDTQLLTHIKGTNMHRPAYGGWAFSMHSIYIILATINA